MQRDYGVVEGRRRALSLMARGAALYFGRTSPRLPSTRDRDLVYLFGLHAGVGVLVCEALWERSEQRAKKYPAAACKTGARSRGLARTHPLNDHSDVPIGTARSYRLRPAAL